MIEGAASCLLVVNADDFGISEGVNRGIAEAHERGVVTSASLMVLRETAAAAAAYAGRRPALSVGLHLDLGEWVYDGGEWRTTYARVPLDDRDAVTAEIERQLTRFRELMGRDPTHVDSHQHVHREQPAASVVRRLGQQLGIPVRHFSRLRYCGDFYGQAAQGEPYPEGIGVERLIAVLRALPSGATELACHPGYPDGLRSPYAAEREAEVRALCDLRVRAALDHGDVALHSFADLPASPP
jgi:predicted glycoside hydrolase/deacetylase ChbG (UPF0249 family)